MHSSYPCDLSCDLIAYKHSKYFLNVHNCLTQLIGALAMYIIIQTKFSSYLINTSYLVIEIVSLAVTKYG